MDREQSHIMLSLALNAPNPEAQRHIFGAMSAMADERKETCIHCRSVWYAIHFKDGVCHGCQQKDMPGRSALQASQFRLRLIWFFFVKLPLWTLAGLVLANVLC